MSALVRCVSLTIAVVVAIAAAGAAYGQSSGVVKTNPMKVYMHYMPWFETPATLGGGDWGYHWEMTNQNPNIIDADGRRQIASHFYPKIGPYASRDPHVIEYHLLLMKYSGVDGLVIDWYGTKGTNDDINNLLVNSNALVDRVDDFGLKFSVMLEDRFAGDEDAVGNVQANVAYLRDNYFNKPEYIRSGPDNDPLMMGFGPIKLQQAAQWTQVFSATGVDPEFLPLWYESNDAGVNADGEFAWIYEDAGQNNYQTHVRNFYVHRAPGLRTAAGIAFLGFEDFYEEGGLGEVVHFDIPHDNGATLAATLALAQQYQSRIDMLQLATWNDFGEGTMFEPTVETGYAYLRQLQQFTGVAYGEPELELISRLYRARKQFASDAGKQTQLDQVAALLSSLEVDEARTLLESLAPPGDFDGDGVTTGQDFMLWQRQNGGTGVYPLGTLSADGNADGVVDGADLAIWRGGFAAAGLPAELGDRLAVPEPAGYVQAALLLLTFFMRRCA